MSTATVVSIDAEKRVQEICTLLQEGFTPRDISTMLDSTPMDQKTFQGYIASIRDKARYRLISDNYDFSKQKKKNATTPVDDLTPKMFEEVYPDIVEAFERLALTDSLAEASRAIHTEILADILQEKYPHYSYNIMHAYVTTVIKSLLRNRRVLSGKRLPSIERANDRVFANKFTDPFKFDPKRLAD